MPVSVWEYDVDTYKFSGMGPDKQGLPLPECGHIKKIVIEYSTAGESVVFVFFADKPWSPVFLATLQHEHISLDCRMDIGQSCQVKVCDVALRYHIDDQDEQPQEGLCVLLGWHETPVIAVEIIGALRGLLKRIGVVWDPLPLPSISHERKFLVHDHDDDSALHFSETAFLPHYLALKDE